MKRFRNVILAGICVLSLTVSVYADHSEKTELPQSSTDYYMTVDSGGIGVDIYPETSNKSEKLNNATVEDGTVLHIEGETEKNGKNWGYTEYNGIHGYVPLDELRPSKDEELKADAVSADIGTGAETDINEKKVNKNQVTEKEKDTSETEKANAEKTDADDASEDSPQKEARPVNGTMAKSFKQDNIWYENPFLWIGAATVLGIIGILGYHLKKR